MSRFNYLAWVGYRGHKNPNEHIAGYPIAMFYAEVHFANFGKHPGFVYMGKAADNKNGAERRKGSKQKRFFKASCILAPTSVQVQKNHCYSGQ